MNDKTKIVAHYKLSELTVNLFDFVGKFVMRISGLFTKLDNTYRPKRDGADAGLNGPDALAFCNAYEGLNLGGFWSTDAEGRLTHLSDHTSAILSPAGDWRGRNFADLFTTSENDQDSVRNLQFSLVRKSRFERVTAQSMLGDEARCWTVSGEPQLSASSEFMGFRGVCSDITNDRRDADENSRLAMYDPLTGLLNRRNMSQLLEKTLRASRLDNRKCATLLIDLDHFKQINDTLGHSVGDLLLKQVSDRLLRIIDDPERVCRLGGDEFQILLPNQEDRGSLGDLAERVIAMLSQPYTVEGNRCLIGASVGIAISPYDGDSADEFVSNADLALYAAKNSGRGRFRFFSRDMLEAAEQRRKLGEDLEDALTNGEFELLYQPIVGAETNKVTGAEALIRWNHPEKGPIMPSQFIPIAEESSLICRIGEWVLRTACEDAAKWANLQRVAVNISPVQFIEPSFINHVARALSASGLDPDRLEIEITEGVFLQESGATNAIFQKIKSLGVRLALDDFGTGYSSLAYLKTAPFDKIKIDQSFVRGATQHGSRSKAIITAIVSLANALDMETTAEGIETFDQLQMIREQGVSHVQGFIYSMPITQEEYLKQSAQADWGIEPSGYATQRNDRLSMYQKIGAIHENFYYPVILKNLSASGAMIEGILDVPIGTKFVLDFGEGQLALGKVTRCAKDRLGVEFERPLVSDGNGGLCTSHRVSSYMLAAAGMPQLLGKSKSLDTIKLNLSNKAIPKFRFTSETLPMFSNGVLAA